MSRAARVAFGVTAGLFVALLAYAYLPWALTLALFAASALAGAVGVLVWLRRRRAVVPLTPIDEPEATGLLELKGDVEITGNARFPGGLRVRGALFLAPGCRLEGDVHTDLGVSLDEGASITGRVTAGGELRLASGARVGPTTAAGEAVVAIDARVGGRLECERLRLAPSTAMATFAPDRADAPERAPVAAPVLEARAPFEP